MEKAFWTAGPIPPAHLDALAIQRPAATAAVLAALKDGKTAWIGGPPGCGQTTLLHQAARAAGRPVLVVDLRALLVGGPAEALAHVVQGRPSPSGRAPKDWAAAAAAWDPGALLAFDGADPARHGWVADVAREAGRPVLAAGAGGPIVPDAVADATATAFLERRARRARLGWTGAALREAVGLAAGDPGTLQALGGAALHSCLERGEGRIAIDDVLEAAVEVAQHRAGGAPPWRRVAGPRRALLMAMAREPEGTPTSWARRCGMDPKAAVVHLRRLAVDDGLVRREGRGVYTMPPMLRLALRPSGGAVVRLVRPGGPPAGGA